MSQKTIVSQATPYGYSSIAVIRISGKKSMAIVRAITKTKNSLKDRAPTLLPVYDENNKKFDISLFTFFKNPRSYTGEDIIEISCHGNPVICRKIINRVVEEGGVLAKPGEYTKRAFLNGKMSLSEAESVGLLIASKSEEALNINLKNIEGTTSRQIEKIKDSLLECLSGLEFEFDISEDEDTEKTISISIKSLKKLVLETRSLVLSFKKGVAFNHGVRVAIVGRPNVGKSTLMNKITQSNRSITSEIPGTTRDTVIKEIIISGVPITLVDTAGIRKNPGAIEGEGVKRTFSEITKSDLVISLFSYNSEPVNNIELTKQILVYNKSDIKKNTLNKNSVISISALTGIGIEKLEKKLASKIKNLTSETGSQVLVTERQRQNILACEGFIKKALSRLQADAPELELVAFDIRAALLALDSFLGKNITESVLNRVFSNFCVGK